MQFSRHIPNNDEPDLQRGYHKTHPQRNHVTNGSDRMSDLDGFEQRFTKDLANATLAMISDDTRRLSTRYRANIPLAQLRQQGKEDLSKGRIGQ